MPVYDDNNKPDGDGAKYVDITDPKKSKIVDPKAIAAAEKEAAAAKAAESAAADEAKKIKGHGWRFTGSPAEEAKRKEKDDYVAQHTRTRRFRLNAKTFSRRRVISGIIGITMIGSGFGLLGFLINFQADHITNMIVQRISGPVRDAIGNRIEHYFYSALTQKYLPGLQACNSGRGGGVVRSTDVCPDFDFRSRGIGGKLYSASSPFNRAVQDMLRNGDIVIEYHPGPSRARSPYTLIMKGNTVGDFSNGSVSEVRQQMNRFDLGDFLNNRILAETQNKSMWRNRLDRYHMRRAMRSMDVPRFHIPGSKTYERARTGVRVRVGKIKAELIRRAVLPLSQRYGVYMLCLNDPDKCSPDDFDTGYRRLAQEAGEEAVDAFEDIADAISRGDTDNFIMKRILQRTLTRFIGQQAASRATNAIPVIGQILLAMTISDMLNRIDDALFEDDILLNIQKDLIESQYVGLASTMRTSVDTTKAGDMALGNAGETSELFKDYDKESKVYQAYFAGKNDARSTRTCKGDREMADDEYVCPEERVDHRPPVQEIIDHPVAQTFHRVYDLFAERCVIPGGGVQVPGPGDVRTPCPRTMDDLLRDIVGAIDSVAGAVGDFFLGPVMDAAQDMLRSAGIDVTEIASDVMTFFMEFLFHTPLKPTTAGGLIFDAYQGGMDILTQNFAAGGVEPNPDMASFPFGDGLVGGTSYGLGAPEVSETEARERYAQLEQKELDTFAALPLWKRLFDTSSQYSFATRTLMSIDPQINVSGAFASAPSNLISSIGNMFSSLFGGKVKAAPSALNMPASPHGVAQHMVPREWETTDPETLTEEECARRDQTWINSRNGETAKFGEPNQCLFERTVVSILNGDSEERGPVINPEAGSGPVGSPSQPGTDTSAQTCPIVDTSITDGGIGQKYAPGRVLEYNIRLCNVRTPSGRTITVNVSVAANLARMLRAAGAAGVSLNGSGYRTYDRQVELRADNGCPRDPTAPSSSCDVPTAPPGRSNHEGGEAVDFENCSSRSTACYRWLAGNAGQYNFFNFPREAWHWSIDGR